MVCKICGKQLPDGSSVCKYCGAKQRKPDPSARPAPSHRYSKKGLARRRMINTVLIGIVALLIVGVIAGIAASTRSAGEEHKAQLSADQTNQDAQTDKKENESEADDKTDKPDESKKDDKTDKPDESKKDDKTDKPDESKKDDKAEKPDASKQDDKTEKPADSDQSGVIGEGTEKPVDESDKPADGESEEPDEPTGETQTPTQPQIPTAPTGNYTASINRTTVVASLNHYRILTVSINQSLPTGVEVKSVSFTSSDSSIVRTEVVDGEGRAWGVRLGKATVTGTVTLNTGETASASCEVTVEEYKEPVPESSSGSSTGSGNTGSSGSTGSSGDSGSTSYILSGSNTRVYSVSELSKLSDSQLRLARNEIYARHGRIFNDPVLQRYFEGKSWYKGTIPADKFDVSVLNAVEEQNIENIQKAEAN